MIRKVIITDSKFGLEYIHRGREAAVAARAKSSRKEDQEGSFPRVT